MAHRESIVEYFAEHEGYKCGYCKSPTTNFSHGMWAHSLKPTDYEEMLTRGWRRSGKYLYKPTNNITCCPMYTISCHALEFKPTRSQKKVLRRFNQYLFSGEIKEMETRTNDHEMSECIVRVDYKERAAHVSVDTGSLNQDWETGSVQESSSSALNSVSHNSVSCFKESPRQRRNDNEPSPSLTSSFQNAQSITKDKSKKAKQMRIERKRQKLIAKGIDPATVLRPKRSPEPKTIEDFLVEVPEAKVTLCVRLLKTNSPEFEKFISLEHNVYMRYQMSIHGDAESECTLKQFKRFLCENPMNDSTDDFTGAYHQQYYLNEKLVAVGVIDLLPNSLSSVYFFYDPDFMSLALGTYGALREIAFVRELSIAHPSLTNYYMGFYIHSCIKMRYKGNYSPSFLLCPETYTWKLLDDGLKNKLNMQKYTRLDTSNHSAENRQQDIKKVMILHRRCVMPYTMYELKRGVADKDQIQQYCNLVGERVANKLLLYRS